MRMYGLQNTIFLCGLVSGKEITLGLRVISPPKCKKRAPENKPFRNYDKG